MLKFVWPWMIVLLPIPWLLIISTHLKSKVALVQNITQFLRKYVQPKVPVPTIIFPRIVQLKLAFTHAGGITVKALDWRVCLLALAWLGVVLALMRPEFVKDVAYASTSGYDLMLAVDLSRSMEIADFSSNGTPITRIAATKNVVANFVQQRIGDRIGLIVFAEQAFLTIPLTMDTKAVSALLNNLVIGMAGERTAIGDAIGIGVRNLRKRPAESRVLILLTDGADTASHVPPLEAAKIAARDGIKIYTIGVGDNLDEALLKSIAHLTSGVYFKVTNVNELAQVYKEIDLLEKSEAQQNVVLIRDALFQLPLVIALLCLGMVFIISANKFRYKYEFS